MMIIRIFWLIIVINYGAFVGAQIEKISTDCDTEFAETATALAAEQVFDPTIIQYIHAVMSSCNKAPIQKMAEVSVFLLHKGAVTPRVMGDIREAFDRIQRKKEVEMTKKLSKLPPELYATAQKIQSISTSGGLSGNERRQHIRQAMNALPASYHHQIYQVFATEPSKLDGAPFEQKAGNPIEIITAGPPASVMIHQEKPRAPVMMMGVEQEMDIPKSIEIPKDPLIVPRINMPFQPRENRNFPTFQPHPPNRQNSLFPDQHQSRPIEPLVQNKAADIRKFLENPNFEGLLNTIVQKGAKIANGPLPESVGSVDHTKIQKELGLLNPSLWTDAAKLFSRNSNDLPTALSTFLDQHSHQMPQILVPPGPHQIRQSPKISPFLPTRRQNDGALDKFDTHIDRFASSGPANGVKIQGDLSYLKVSGPPPAITPNQAIAPKPPIEPVAIVGAMPTMPPAQGYGTYAPAPSAIVPKVVAPLTPRVLSPEEITGSYRQIQPVYNQRLANGQYRNVHIDLVNEQ